MNSKATRVFKGTAAGLAGGLAAAWVMSQFQAGLKKVTKNPKWQEGNQNYRSEDATVKAASDISKALTGKPLSKARKRAAGPVVHYAFGSVLGGAYGALAGWKPGLAAGWGLPFGTAVWLMMDEGVAPAFGWSKPPAEVPKETHASALASHLVYGVTTDLIRRGARLAM